MLNENRQYHIFPAYLSTYHKNLYLSGVEIFIDSGTRQIHELYHHEYKCEFKNLKYIDDLIKNIEEARNRAKKKNGKIKMKLREQKERYF